MNPSGRHLVDGMLRPRSPLRNVVGWLIAVVGPIAIALILLPFRSAVGLGGTLFFTLLLVIAVSAIGGTWPAIAAAAVGLVAAEFFYAPPYQTLSIHLSSDRSAIIVFGVAGAVVAILVGMLIDQLARLANEQGALRRVATLVARAAPPDELFEAVAQEVSKLLAVEITVMHRYEGDGSVAVVAAWTEGNPLSMLGAHYRLGGSNIATQVAETGHPVRMDNCAKSSGELAGAVSELGVRSAVGTPIIVDGRLWGLMVAATDGDRSLPRDAEVRLAAFTDLVGTAIANAESRSELAASRARVVAAADEARRRIERDLHDGAQQRLVSLGLEVRIAQSMVPPEMDELNVQLSRIVGGVNDVGEELQELSRGVHPAVLSRGGIVPAIKMLGRRSPVPVELDLRCDQRLPDWVEVAVYFVTAEALTNAAKHSQASVIRIDFEVAGGLAVLAIHDDGIGGADSTNGSGLAGLKDRVEAFGGRIEMSSPLGAGTSLRARMPVDKP